MASKCVEILFSLSKINKPWVDCMIMLWWLLMLDSRCQYGFYWYSVQCFRPLPQVRIRGAIYLSVSIFHVCICILMCTVSTPTQISFKNLEFAIFYFTMGICCIKKINIFNFSFIDKFPLSWTNIRYCWCSKVCL